MCGYSQGLLEGGWGAASNYSGVVEVCRVWRT